MQYRHTQTGAFHYILYFVAAVMALVVWFFAGTPGLVQVLLGVPVMLVVLAWLLQCMTVRDEGDRVAICYSPLDIPLKRILYSQIQSVKTSRTKILDGWGIHWIPGRGTTYNVWGFDCVELQVGNRLIRIGSDDADNLAAFLRPKIE